MLFTSAQCTVFCIVSNRQGDTLSRFDSTSMRRVGFNDLVSALSAVYIAVDKINIMREGGREGRGGGGGIFREGRERGREGREED